MAWTAACALFVLLVFGFYFQEDRKTNLLVILMKSGCGLVVEFTQTGM